MATTTLQNSGIIQLSARDQKKIYDALTLESEEVSVERFAKLRLAIQRSREMAGQSK